MESLAKCNIRSYFTYNERINSTHSTENRSSDYRDVSRTFYFIYIQVLGIHKCIKGAPPHATQVPPGYVDFIGNIVRTRYAQQASVTHVDSKHPHIYVFLVADIFLPFFIMPRPLQIFLVIRLKKNFTIKICGFPNTAFHFEVLRLFCFIISAQLYPY